MVSLLGLLVSCNPPFALPPKPPVNFASIAPSRIAGVAPLAVHFDATGSTSSVATTPFREILYTWDFGDSASATQTWPYGARAGSLSKNADTGPVAAHVFEQPGDYIVKLTCQDGRSTYSATVGIHVDDPAAVYAGANTICVSTSAIPVPGTDGVPAGAQCYKVSKVEDAVAKLSGKDQRLLFRRGESFTVSSTVYLGNTPGLTIGAYGTGAKPMVVCQNVVHLYGFSPQADDFRIMDLQFSTVQTGSFDSRMVTTTSRNQLLLNLDGQGISCISELGGTYNFAVNCTLTQAKGGSGNVGIWYAVYGTGGALLGNRIVDCTGIEHNIRTHGANKTVIAHNYLAIPNPYKKLLTIRGIDNSKESRPGEFWSELILISDNQFGSDTEAGGSLQVAPEATDFNEPVRKVIIEKNLFSGPSAAPSSAGFDCGEGLVFRNNIALIRGGSSGSFCFLILQHSNVAGSPTARDCWFVNNSLYSDHVGDFSFLQAVQDSSPDPYDNHVLNNLVFVPNSERNAAGNGVGDVVSLFSLIMVTAANTSDAQLKDTFPGWVVNPPATVSDLVLTTGSYAHNSGTSAPVLEDYYGNLRTGAMDIGAVSLDP